jgi:hypothetical protein
MWRDFYSGCAHEMESIPLINERNIPSSGLFQVDCIESQTPRERIPFFVLRFNCNRHLIGFDSKYCDAERAIAEIHRTVKEESQRKKTTILRMEMSYSRLRIISSAAPAAGTDAVIALSDPRQIAKHFNVDREDYQLTLLL